MGYRGRIIFDTRESYREGSNNYMKAISAQHEQLLEPDVAGNLSNFRASIHGDMRHGIARGERENVPSPWMCADTRSNESLGTSESRLKSVGHVLLVFVRSNLGEVRWHSPWILTN